MESLNLYDFSKLFYLYIKHGKIWDGTFKPQMGERIF